MKKLLYYTLSVVVLTACDDTDGDVTIHVPAEAFEFRATMGGAVMHYYLPDDPDVVGIHVRYQDAYGAEILRTGSTSCDSLTLIGFNEARQHVPAQITLQLYDGRESQPIQATFDTEDSAPIQFINSASVESGWDGFSVSYKNPSETRGLGHIYYLGTNAYTGLADTVLLTSFALSETDGVQTDVYTLKQNVGITDVIIRAEDYRGYIVKERVWKDVTAFQTARVDPSSLTVSYNNSFEYEDEKVGLQYLTDGDTKGACWFDDGDYHHYYTFCSQRGGAGPDSEPMYVDLGEAKPTAEVRLYAYCNLGYGNSCRTKPCWCPDSYYCVESGTAKFNKMIMSYYSGRLPNDVTIYGCRQATSSSDYAAMTWEPLGHFAQAKDSELSDQWCYGAPQTNSVYGAVTKADIEDDSKTPPVYMSVKFPASGQGAGYRYLKIVFNDVFYSPYEADYASWGMSFNGSNESTKYVTLHELEVYGKKDE